MADTGAPHFIPFVEPTDLVREYPAADEAQAFAVAAGLTAAGNAGIGSNVVQTVKTDRFTTSSQTFVEVTGTSTSITPTSATSKVLVIVQGVAGAEAGADVQLQLRRASTDIYIGTGGGFVNVSGDVDTTQEHFSLVFLDSPETASSVSYVLRIGRDGSGSISVGTNAAGTRGFPTSVTLIEVAA